MTWQQLIDTLIVVAALVFACAVLAAMTRREERKHDSQRALQREIERRAGQ